MGDVKRTALFESHRLLGAKMVPFGGWQMPVSYGSVLTEHHHVRNHAGIFDVSHMGEIFVSGPDSLDFLQYLTINDVAKLEVGKGQYTALLNLNGGFVDDLILYRLKSDTYLACVNASNIIKDFEWMLSQKSNFDVTIKNESPLWSQIALQGPKTFDVLGKLGLKEAEKLSYMQVVETTFKSNPVLIARTGYTGELGVEIYLKNDSASFIWNVLLEISSDVKPIGLGARDTLRLEAGYLLYGNDMNEKVTPLSAGIGWATKLEKENFLGKEVLVKQKSNSVQPWKIFAFKMIDDGIPRGQMKAYRINQDSTIIGEVTSGSVLPTVGGAGGLVSLDSSFKEGDEFKVDIRGSMKRAIVTKRPLYLAKIK